LGPKACGKTHLLEIWATEQNAQKIDPLREFAPPEAGARVVVDNLEQVAGILPAETRLFHLHNQLQSSGGLLLMASNIAMRQAGFQLPDLLSRLEGTSCAKIDRPDDALLHAVLLKSFMDRQLSPTPAVLAYILKNMDRSFDAASDIVAELDRQSMSTKRPITRAMAATVMA
jgi:chromosomal replication initiation ATPase DnaA